MDSIAALLHPSLGCACHPSPTDTEATWLNAQQSRVSCVRSIGRGCRSEVDETQHRTFPPTVFCCEFIAFVDKAFRGFAYGFARVGAASSNHLESLPRLVEFIATDGNAMTGLRRLSRPVLPRCEWDCSYRTCRCALSRTARCVSTRRILFLQNSAQCECVWTATTSFLSRMKCDSHVSNTPYSQTKIIQVNSTDGNVHRS